MHHVARSRNERVGKKIEASLVATELFSVPSRVFMHYLKGLSGEHIWTVFKSMF